MNNLINVTLNENQEPVVSGRQLYQVLGVKKRFSAWFEQYSDIFSKGYDFTGVPGGTPVRGGNGNIQYLDDYALSVDMAKHIAIRKYKTFIYDKYLLFIFYPAETPTRAISASLRAQKSH